MAVLVYERIALRRERDTMLKAVELAIVTGKEEREAHRAQVDKLLTRIQAPEAASFLDPSTVIPKQYVSEDDDIEGWKAIAERNGT